MKFPRIRIQMKCNGTVAVDVWNELYSLGGNNKPSASSPHFDLIDKNVKSHELAFRTLCFRFYSPVVWTNTWNCISPKWQKTRREKYIKIAVLVTFEIYDNLILKLNLFVARDEKEKREKINKQTDKLKWDINRPANIFSNVACVRFAINFFQHSPVDSRGSVLSEQNIW